MDLKIIFLVGCLIGAAFAQSTNFVNKDSKLVGFAEPQWYKDNIPFVEVPDRQIEEVYYYRFSSHKRHLRYSVPGVGYTVTEFVHKVGYSQKFDTINAAAGHHIYESRWLRNPRYSEDYINFWSREGAANQQYSEWIADAAFSTFLLSGNKDFIASQQEGFVNNFNGWDNRYEPALDMYFLSPHDDAMEHSASSEQTDDPYHGGLGYRPSFNSEMYANAVAISKIARLNNDTRTAEEFEGRAAAIRRGILEHLWDDDRTFFYHMFREDNPNNELLDTREEIGLFPWRFGVPDPEDPKYARAWEHLFDPQGFDSAYGPTTCEQRSRWFDGNQTAQCCWWNGNSWPYSTGMVINSLGAQLRNYGSTNVVNVNTFLEVLHKYAETQYKNDKPYVAECHSPYRKLWVCDGFNHSEHYAHSTYVDNVLGDLLGIEPQSDNSFVINPLMPSTWPYFIVENLNYHGHNITVLYDSDGSKYNTGTGMKIFLNGEEAASQSQLGRMSINIPPPIVDESYARKKVENYAANVNGFGYPMVDASFTSIDASVWQVVDGRVIYDHIPSNRWTNYQTRNEQDWFSVDFGPGRKKVVDEVKVNIYSDVATGEGDVDCPTSIRVEYMSSRDPENWEQARNQVSTPAVCVPNDVITIRFDPVKVEKIRLVFSRNTEDNWFVGMTEVEIWAPWPQVEEEGTYEAEDGYIVNANIRAAQSASGGSFVGQIDANDASVEFTGVWVEESKEYDVQVYYSNGEDEATMSVSANNVNTQEGFFPPTINGWGQFDSNTFVTLRIPLLRGNNAIMLNWIKSE
ncbi:Beta-L-arabinobiosidase [Orchesella cincta]|uniref:Beta-L-arabinobiosidase n=1 Tax=Orchesella cincta TaxID=48709 RepID=A0A1D2NEH5_ORCCI|nr:Beta-L-arabinobiosidase [Orchesella cincta]